MKIKNILLLGVSIMILTGCGGETDEGSEDGMGTLNTESENTNNIEEDAQEGSEATDLNEEKSEVTTSDNGLMDLNNTEPGWINFEGILGGSSEYRTTEPIEYDSSQDYELTRGAYIVYYNGDEYIKTVQESEGTIEKVENADNIRVSYHKSFSEVISLTEK